MGSFASQARNKLVLYAEQIYEGEKKNRADSEGGGVLHMTLICLTDTTPLLAFRNENRNLLFLNALLSPSFITLFLSGLFAGGSLL